MKNLKLIPVLFPSDDVSKIGDLVMCTKLSGFEETDKKIPLGYLAICALAGMNEQLGSTTQHLFLCSTGEIKDGDWHLAFDVDGKVIDKRNSIKYKSALDRKIEFTSDPKLIADGVSALPEKCWIANVNIKEGDKLTHINANEIHTFVRWEGTMFVTRYETEIGKGEDWTESSLFKFKEQEVNFLEEFVSRYNNRNVKGVDVDELAFKECGNDTHGKEKYKKGYNQAMKSNAGGFSLQNIKDAFFEGQAFEAENEGARGLSEFIQSLTPKLQEEIEMYCEMDTSKSMDKIKFPDKIKLKDGQPIIYFK